MDYVWQLCKLVMVLALFIGGAYAILRMMKRKQLNQVSPNRYIQVIDGVSIGLKEEVVLMKVGTEYVLMAVGSGTMIALKQEEIKVPDVEFDAFFARENPTTALRGLKRSLKERMVKK